MKIRNTHIGSAFDDCLEEGLLAEVNETAIKRVIAWQLQQEITSKRMTKTNVAKAMGTSRAAVDRLLDPDNTSITLNTLGKVANILGKRIKIELGDKKMPYITSIERMGVEKGRQEGQKDMLIALLDQKLTGLPTPIKNRVEALSPEQLQALGKTLLGFGSIDDLTTWLDNYNQSDSF
jgi:antitoxin HicB